MLNRSKVIRELNTLSGSLFVDYSGEYTLARQLWDKICKDPTLIYKIKSVESPWLLPSWEGQLDTALPIKELEDYTIVSVDGSQIYPDKHQGTPCYLINVGEVVISYGDRSAPVLLNSEPYLFTGQEQDSFELTTDLVGCQRQEFEFKAGLERSKTVRLQDQQSANLFLMDGTLIFWYLDSKETVSRKYLDSYLVLLEEFYNLRIPIAGYISLPKNKEISNLLRIAMSDFKSDNMEKAKAIDHVIDAAVAQFFLEPCSRSIVFKSNASITDYYPDHLKPYFFYVHVGNEIGRVELPKWLAHDEEKVDLIAAIVLSQSVKGNGYPVALAEAHEQAVVKGPDRDFFYHLISKAAFEQKRSVIKSQKSIKKRGIRI